MLTLTVALAIVVGIAGIIVPVLPGSALIGGAVATWIVLTPYWPGRIIAGIGIIILLATAIAQYLIPGKRLKASGIPHRTLLVGGLLAVVGMFVIPVLGLPLGFVLGTYLSEGQRLGFGAPARESSLHALKAVALSIGIELTGAVLCALAFGTAVAVSWNQLTAT